MNTLITLIVVVAVVCVLLWLINKIPNPQGSKPEDMQLIKFLLDLIVIAVAIWKVWPLL